MRIKAIVGRVIRQFFRDKRTLALLIIAPMFIFTLLNYVLDQHDVELQIGVENKQVETILHSLEKNHELTIMTKAEAEKQFKDKGLDAYVSIKQKGIEVIVNGSDSAITQQVMTEIQASLKEKMASQSVATPSIEMKTFYGDDDMELFDYTGPVFIGFFIFFFVFLISGVSFLRERTTGTLERLLATPIRRYEIVIGYLIGFGIFTIFQSTIVSIFSVYVLKVYNAGAFGLIVLISVIISLCALSLGTLLSFLANNELQMVQFIPLVIVPQAFFSGLFSIEGMAQPLQWLSKVMPLTYATDALQEVMIRGGAFMDILPDLGVLLLFTTVFAILTIVALKKHRTW
ncbi:MAG: ABC transporter permease [Bacillaceae bacterium]